MLGYLAFHGWSTRKQITAGVGIPSPSIYARVMAELLDSGKVIAKGEKAKRVHGLKRTGKAKAAAKKSTKKVPALKRASVRPT